MAPLAEVVAEEPAAIEDTVAPVTPVVDAAAKPIVAEAQQIETEAVESDYPEENTNDLRPGDIIVGDDTSSESVDNTESVATDTTIE